MYKYSRDQAQVDKRRANLTGADLRKADLRFVNLKDADLAGADMTGASLTWVDLTGANLTGVNLRGATLNGVIFRGATLESADMDGAHLRGNNFEEANLRWADLRGADIRFAILRGANLEGASLIEANLAAAILRKANLRKASLEDAILEDTFLEGATLYGANLEDTNLRRTHLWRADLSGVLLNWVNPSQILDYIPSFLGAKGLSNIKIDKNLSTIVELRRKFKEAGFKNEEKSLTSALRKHHLNEGGPNYYYFEKYLLGGLLTDFGANPAGALISLLGLIFVFVWGYLLALKQARWEAGIWRIRPENRLLRDDGESNRELVINRLIIVWTLCGIFCCFTMIIGPNALGRFLNKSQMTDHGAMKLLWIGYHLLSDRIVFQIIPYPFIRI